MFADVVLVRGGGSDAFCYLFGREDRLKSQRAPPSDRTRLKHRSLLWRLRSWPLSRLPQATATAVLAPKTELFSEDVGLADTLTPLGGGRERNSLAGAVNVSGLPTLDGWWSFHRYSSLCIERLQISLVAQRFVQQIVETA